MKQIKTTVNQELIMFFISSFEIRPKRNTNEDTHAYFIRYSIYEDLYYKFLKLLAKQHRVNDHISVKLKLHEALAINNMLIGFLAQQEDQHDMYITTKLRKLHLDIDQQLPTLTQLNITA
jgi:hypothetical protein